MFVLRPIKIFRFPRMKYTATKSSTLICFKTIMICSIKFHKNNTKLKQTKRFFLKEIWNKLMNHKYRNTKNKTIMNIGNFMNLDLIVL